MANHLYSWDAWFSAGSFRLVKGKDYKCSTLSMAQQIRNIAALKDLRISITETSDGLLVSVMTDCSTGEAS